MRKEQKHQPGAGFVANEHGVLFATHSFSLLADAVHQVAPHHERMADDAERALSSLADELEALGARKLQSERRKSLIKLGEGWIPKRRLQGGRALAVEVDATDNKVWTVYVLNDEGGQWGRAHSPPPEQFEVAYQPSCRRFLPTDSHEHQARMPKTVDDSPTVNRLAKIIANLITHLNRP